MNHIRNYKWYLIFISSDYNIFRVQKNTDYYFEDICFKSLQDCILYIDIWNE